MSKKYTEEFIEELKKTVLQSDSTSKAEAIDYLMLVLKISHRQARRIVSQYQIWPEHNKNKAVVEHKPILHAHTPIKRLFWDIETSPNVVLSWRIGYKINLDHDNILQ